MSLGESIRVAPERIYLVLSADMTKNGLPWETIIPQVIEPLLRRYVDEVRPWLMNRRGTRHDYLWVGSNGRPLRPQYLGVRIAEITTRLTGARVPPHLFRDAAATTLSRLSPENARLIRPLLAHSSYGTAERHYIQAQGIETGRDYASVLAAFKERQER